MCQKYLPGDQIYSCCHCRAHLASHDEIISKSFQGNRGRAYLFNSLCGGCSNDCSSAAAAARLQLCSCHPASPSGLLNLPALAFQRAISQL